MDSALMQRGAIIANSGRRKRPPSTPTVKKPRQRIGWGLCGAVCVGVRFQASKSKSLAFCPVNTPMLGPTEALTLNLGSGGLGSSAIQTSATQGGLKSITLNAV